MRLNISTSYNKTINFDYKFKNNSAIVNVLPIISYELFSEYDTPIFKADCCLLDLLPAFHAAHSLGSFPLCCSFCCFHTSCLERQ